MGKIFYDKDGNELIIDLKRDIIGEGLCGVVYHVNEEICLKHIVNSFSTNKEALEEFIKLDLESFYKIYKLLYDRHNRFAGYLMKYYESEEIDIMTMPIDYTLDNLYRMLRDIKILSENNILVEDMHIDNIIMNRDRIINIDVDNYMLIQKNSILTKNTSQIYSLFKGIYIEALLKYYEVNHEEITVARNLFNTGDKDFIYNELSNYKYPIDYIRKKSLEPIKYVMKKDIEY